LIPLAPRFTPGKRCFLRHPLSIEEHDLRECYFFSAMSNPDRVKLPTNQHRCFGCFQPTALVTHELNRCPHTHYCAMYRTPDHHQLLCAPSKSTTRRCLDPRTSSFSCLTTINTVRFCSLSRFHFVYVSLTISSDCHIFCLVTLQIKGLLLPHSQISL
jgi:hypothetical protein